RTDRTLEFRQIASQYIVRTSKQTANLPFPMREVLQHSAKGDVGYEEAVRLLRDTIEHVDPMNQVNLGVAMMSSNAAFAKQLQNMSSKKAQLSPYAHQAQALAEKVPLGPKFAGLRRLVTELRSNTPDFR